MTGPDALRWRHLALENDSEEIKKQFDEDIRTEVPDGVEAEFDHFTGLDEYNVPLVAIVKIDGHLGTATGKRFFLPGLFFQSHGALPFVSEGKRTAPIDVRYAKMSQDDVTYHLPPGFTSESAPQAADLSWADHALMKIRSAAKDNSVQVSRLFAYNFSLLGAKEYNDLHDFYMKIATADKQQIVLTRVPVSTGN